MAKTECAASAAVVMTCFVKHCVPSFSYQATVSSSSENRKQISVDNSINDNCKDGIYCICNGRDDALDEALRPVVLSPGLRVDPIRSREHINVTISINVDCKDGHCSNCRGLDGGPSKALRSVVLIPGNCVVT